jgi:hypothetical protein
MTGTRLRTLALLALLMPGAAALAHHGTAGFYDKTKLIAVQGVVREFRWRNPHSGLFIVARDAAGNEVTYSLEMGSPNSLAKVGFSRKTFKPGDRVDARMHPAFANPLAGEVNSREVTVNGKPIHTGGASKSED